MPSAFALRVQIEASLKDRIPSALSPMPRTVRPRAPTGIPTLDGLLDGGFPVGAITELAGPECSGRTSLALSFLAQTTSAAKICAWIDLSNAFDPESAAAAGVDLARLLWVRCGIPNVPKVPTEPTAPQSPQPNFSLPKKYLVPPPAIKGLHGGGFGPHPQTEAKGLSEAVASLLHTEAFASIAPRCAEPQRRVKPTREAFESASFQPPDQKEWALRSQPCAGKPHPAKPWTSIEQALRVADLLLQAGGFSAIVLDMGSITPESASRIPLATWFRYRAAAERTQASILLLTQHVCAKSSAGLVLRLRANGVERQNATVFTGIDYRVEVSRERFTSPPTNVVPLRKPPQRETAASWSTRTAWAGLR